MILKRETVVSVLTVDLSRKVGKRLKYHIITTMNQGSCKSVHGSRGNEDKEPEEKTRCPTRGSPKKAAQSILKLREVTSNSRVSFAEHNKDLISREIKNNQRDKQAGRCLQGYYRLDQTGSCPMRKTRYALRRSGVALGSLIYKNKFGTVQSSVLVRVPRDFRSPAAYMLQGDTSVPSSDRQKEELNRIALKAYQIAFLLKFQTAVKISKGFHWHTG